MSALMVRPGPLEGGPMVSPGPAKEGGEPFSAQLKHAYDQGAFAPVASKTSPNLSEPSERPGKENEASLKEAAPSKDAGPVGSPRSAKGTGKIPAKGPETVSDGVPETSVVDPALIENAETLVVAIPMNLPLAVETTPVEKVETEGDPDVSLLASIAVVHPADLPVAPAEILDETPADSEPPKKEEPVKVEAKPQEAPTSVLLPVNLAVVMPTEPAVPVENEIPLAPVASVKEDPVLIPDPVAVANGPIPAPVFLGPKLAAGLDKDMGPLPKTPELKNVVRPKDSPELPKKMTESSVPEAAEKTPVDRPDLRVVLDPVPQGIRPEPKVSVTHSPEKEVQRETHPVKEAPLPAVVFQPEVAAPNPLTTDAVPKPKESPGIAPIHSGMAAQSGPPAQGTTESVQNSTPVLEETPAKAGAKAGPVEIARQIHVHLESGRSVVRIDLHPEHLGELRISMETKGKDVSMQFTVDNENARTSVVAGLREITGTLSSLGWSVSGLAVNVSSGGVGNGRGESSGPLWGENRTFSNTLLPESKTPSPKSETGQWRVDLVA